MTYVSLGFIETLQRILQALFEGLLAPILTKMFNVLLGFVGDILSTLFADMFFDLFTIFLKLVRFLEDMFTIFSGLANVKYGDDEMSVISFIMTGNGGISRALALMTAMAAIMAFLFAMYATGKSMSDMTLGLSEKPITAVLKNGLKSALTFMLVPLLCAVMMNFTTILMKQVVTVFADSQTDSINASNRQVDSDAKQLENASIDMASTLFLVAAHDAAKNNSVLVSYNREKCYQYPDQVKKDFDIKKINYVVGFVSCILMIIILIAAILSFIRMTFEIALLYLVSPFFSATIALDGGSRFKRWKDLFVAKFFAGFGSVFSMKLYLLMSPILMSNNLKFGGDEMLDRCIHLFLVIGGAWAVFKGQDNIMNILNPEAASASQASALSAFMLGKGVGQLTSFMKKK